MRRSKNANAKLGIRACGCLICALVGVGPILLPETSLDRLSIDLPFFWSKSRKNTSAVIVYFNQSSLNTLFQTNGLLKREDWDPPLRTNMPPDRRIYVKLLENMKEAGAKLVLFDCDFGESHTNEDESFARAIRTKGPVILGGVYGSGIVQRTGENGGVEGRTILPPTPVLREAATNWGILAVNPGPDKVVRQILTGDGQRNAAIFLAAHVGGFDGKPNGTRWINYFGPANSIDAVQLPEALTSGNDEKFRGRAVFVGGNDWSNPDLHLTPLSPSGMSGVEILATSYSNLVQANWLERYLLALQAVFIIGWGLFSTAFFLSFRPRNIFLMIPLLMALPIAIGFFTQWELNRWWSWAICAFVQTPFAGLWAAYVNRWHPWPPVIFIAYRRRKGEGAGYRQAIASALELRGYASISDVETNERVEDYRERAFELLERVPNFILLLSAGSLSAETLANGDDELVVEIRHAVETGRQIIPVIIDDYEIPPRPAWPENIKAARKLDAVSWRHNDPTSAVDRIVANLRPQPFFQRLWFK